MKRVLGCLLMMVLGFTACEGPMGPPGIDGTNAEPTQWWIKDITVAKSSWQLVGGAPDDIGSYFRCVINVPEITKDIYNDGAIICYYLYKDEFGDDVQTVLPYTYYDISIRQNIYGDNDEFPYSVQFSFDTTPGSIAFKLVFSDFYTKDFGPPPTCKFKLVLIY